MASSYSSSAIRPLSSRARSRAISTSIQVSVRTSAWSARRPSSTTTTCRSTSGCTLARSPSSAASASRSSPTRLLQPAHEPPLRDLQALPGLNPQPPRCLLKSLPHSVMPYSHSTA